MSCYAKSLQSCPTLCDPIDSSPPSSAVPGILQARTLEWVAISFSNTWKWKVKVKSLSRVWLLATPWTAAHQAPLSMGVSEGVPGKGTGVGRHCLLHINTYSLWYNGERGESETRGHKNILEDSTWTQILPFSSHCCQWVWGLGQLIPELLQNCLIYSAASSLFPLQSLLPKNFSPSVTDHLFPNSSQWLQDKFHPPQWDIQGALLSGFYWLSKDPIAAKWIYTLSSASPETASLDLWRLIWYPGAEWCP